MRQVSIKAFKYLELLESVPCLTVTLTPYQIVQFVLNVPRPHPVSCQESYYYDSYAMECLTCSNTAQVAAPLIVMGIITLVVGGVIAYNYKYNYDFWTTYFEEHKERLFMQMNQGTMVVSARVGEGVSE